MLKRTVIAGLASASLLSSSDPNLGRKMTQITKDVPSNISITIYSPSEQRETFSVKSVPKMDDLTIIAESYKSMSKETIEELLDQKSSSTELDLTTPEAMKSNGINIMKKYSPNLVTIISDGTFKNSEGQEGLRIYGKGSGVLLSREGFVFTNYHVIDTILGDTSKELTTISFSNKGEMRTNKAHVVAYSKKRDIALCLLDDSSSYDDLSPVRIRENHFLVNSPVISLNLEYASENSMKGEMEQRVPIEQKAITHPFPKDGLVFGVSDNNGKLSILLDVPFGYNLLASMGNVGDYNDLKSTSFNNPKRNLDVDYVGGLHVNYLIPVIIKAEPGNSGSPVFDSQSNLVGIVSGAHETGNEALMVSHETTRDLIKQYTSYKK